MINLKVRSVMMSIWLCLQALSSALVNKNDGVLKSKHDFSARNPHDFRTWAVLTPSVNLHYFNGFAFESREKVKNAKKAKVICASSFHLSFP